MSREIWDIKLGNEVYFDKDAISRRTKVKPEGRLESDVHTSRRASGGTPGDTATVRDPPVVRLIGKALWGSRTERGGTNMDEIQELVTV